MADFDVEELIKQVKIEAMNQLVAEAINSGVSEWSMEEMLQAARDQAIKAKNPTDG